MTPARRFAVIGVVGGIGSGKSTVAGMLGELGCVVIDSDAQARRALQRPEVIAELVGWWGSGVLDAEGLIDRKAVARIVFADADQRSRLEGLIHPLIAQSRAVQIEEARRSGRAGVVIDAPLLYEAGLERECDAVVFVECPFEDRLARVQASRGWDERELRQREKAQLPLEEKRRRADYLVVNTGNLPDLRLEVAQIFTSITEASESSDGPTR
ncbi:MAG: dephospho-CoA kinase [Phycisphaerales bacterium]|nr:dephospho-CoA kinase [Phycisphaerales bacterium]